MAKKIKGLTDIIVILDRSGSMHTIARAMEKGLFDFVQEQKKVPGEARFTLVQFDSESIDTVYDKVPLGAVSEIRIEPRGWTPLLDAVGKTLDGFKATAEKTIAVIITDGHENSSRKYTYESIKPIIRKFQKGDRQLVFLGANIDSFSVAKDWGINLANTRNYYASAAGAQSMTATLSSSTQVYRNSNVPTAAIFDNSVPDTIEEEVK